MVCLSNLFSEAEPKGTDCLDKFMEMNECMKRHPDLYPESAEDVEEEEEQEVDSEIVNENENTDGQMSSQNREREPSTKSVTLTPYSGP